MPSGQPQPDHQVEAVQVAAPAPSASVDLVNQATLMAKVGLPLTDPGDDLQYWYRTDGDISLILLQGVRTDQRGKPSPRGYPSGYYPRRQLIELVTMAARTGNPWIELGSQRQFMSRMNLRPTGGKTGNIASFVDQLDRLLDASIAVVPFGNPNVSAKATVRIADAYQLWLGRGQERPAGFKEFVRLSDPFFDQVVNHHVELDKGVIERLGGKALQLDIYTWLAHCLAFQTEPEVFTWERLRQRFGVQLADTKDGRSQFKRLVRRALNGVLEQMPDDVHVTIDPNAGVRVAPTPRLLVTGVNLAVTAEHLALPATAAARIEREAPLDDSEAAATSTPTLIETPPRRRTRANARPAAATQTGEAATLFDETVAAVDASAARPPAPRNRRGMTA